MAQFNSGNNSFQTHNKTLFESMMIANKNSEIITLDNRFPVDAGAYSSKFRLKVSDFETVFFNTFQYHKEPDIWDEQSTSGGAATFSASYSGVEMSVTSTLGSEIIRQTRQVMRYVPGRSNELSFGIRLTTPTVGVRRRFGLFDENNGVYFEDGGDGNYYCCIRNSNGVTGPTLARIPREQWNGDKLDGTGPYGIVANPNAQQLVLFEYEWYGAGTVSVRWIVDGTPHTIHTFYHANVLNTTWCATPFLPIRLELTNITGAAGNHYLYQGSNSVIQDGAVSKLGVATSIGSPITGTTLTTANVYYPVLSFRLKSTNLAGVVIPTFFQAATLDNTNIFYRIILNGTLTGASFVNHPNVNSFTQYDISATAISGGVDLDSGFIAGASQGGTKIATEAQARYQLGRGSMGTTSDIITIAVAAVNANKAGQASATWVEIR